MNASGAAGPVSPLQLADRLIQLAQDADQAAFAGVAAALLGLVNAVLDGDVQTAA